MRAPRSSARNVDPRLANLRARLASAVNYGHADVDALRTELRTATLEKRIKEALAEQPPLSEEQRRHLAALLIDGCDQHAVVKS